MLAGNNYNDSAALSTNIIGDEVDSQQELTALQNVAIDNTSMLWQAQSSQFQNVIMHEGKIIFCEKNMTDTSTSTIEVVEVLSSSDTLNGMHQNKNETQCTHIFCSFSLLY